MTQTIAGVLRPALRDRPDAPALAAPSGTLTYADLDRLAGAAAEVWATVPEFPLNVMGKIIRTELAALLRDASSPVGDT